MKVCPLTRISSPAPEICANILFTGDVFYTQRVFLYRHDLTEHSGHSGRHHPSGILGVYDRFMMYDLFSKQTSQSFSTGSCSRYSLSSEYARCCASFHCTCFDPLILRRSDSGAKTSAKTGMWSL